MTRLLLPLILVLLFLGSAYRAEAADGCDFSISNVNFGSVTLLGGAAIDTSATLEIVCRNTLDVSLAVRVCPNIGAGSAGAGSGIRYMAGPSGQLLSYQLYQNPGRTTGWGSVDLPSVGAGPQIDILALPLTTTTVRVPIFARLLANQQSAAGGAYISTFGAGQTRIAYTSYILNPPACSSITQNATQVAFIVQANVNRTCDVVAQGINFGSRGLIATDVDATGKLTVTCTPTLAYSIALNGGLSNAAPTQRKMIRGTQHILYGLYRNAGRTSPWGSAAGETMSGTGSGSQQDITIYGRVPAQNTPSAGTYTDTVVVTVTY